MCRHAEDLAVSRAERIVELEGQNKGLILTNAFLRQRPDLPVDRIPVYERMSKRIAQLEAGLNRIKSLTDAPYAAPGVPGEPLVDAVLEWAVNEAENALKETP